MSWIRKEDLHILTHGTRIYTSDSRFQIVHSQETEFWGLKIFKVQIKDNGQYECQVNTDPKISFTVNLSVSGFSL